MRQFTSRCTAALLLTTLAAALGGCGEAPGRAQASPAAPAAGAPGPAPAAPGAPAATDAATAALRQQEMAKMPADIRERLRAQGKLP